MENSLSSPWAGLHVPHVDTSGWLIKQREQAIQDVEQVIRKLQAVHAELIAQIPETRDKNTSIQRLCRVSRTEATRRRKVAMVCAKFPRALELLRSGKVSVEHLLALEPASKHDAAVKLLDGAAGQGVEDFRDTVRQFQLSLENGNDIAKRQRAQRYLRFTDGPDGMVGINGLLPPVEGASFKAALTAMVNAKYRFEHPDRAKVEGGHGVESHEQRMADALLALTEGGLLAKDMTNAKRANKTKSNDTKTSPSESRENPPASGATGTNRANFVDNEDRGPNNAGIDDLGTRFKLITPSKVKPSVVINFNVDTYEAEILGTGPIPITPSLLDMTRNDLYYAFKNMSGEVLKLGRARYEPSAVQRLAIIARDRHCIYPDCTVTSDLCEIHHLNEWLLEQGFTDVEVLGLFCRQHHKHLHKANLVARREPDGTVSIHDRTTGELIATAITRTRVAA